MQLLVVISVTVLLVLLSAFVAGLAKVCSGLMLLLSRCKQQVMALELT